MEPQVSYGFSKVFLWLRSRYAEPFLIIGAGHIGLRHVTWWRWELPKWGIKQLVNHRKTIGKWWFTMIYIDIDIWLVLWTMTFMTFQVGNHRKIMVFHGGLMVVEWILLDGYPLASSNMAGWKIPEVNGGFWLGKSLINGPFSIYWECHHPNWLSYFFQKSWNHQPDM